MHQPPPSLYNSHFGLVLTPVPTAPFPPSLPPPSVSVHVAALPACLPPGRAAAVGRRVAVAAPAPTDGPTYELCHAAFTVRTPQPPSLAVRAAAPPPCRSGGGCESLRMAADAAARVSAQGSGAGACTRRSRSGPAADLREGRRGVESRGRWGTNG